MGRERESEAGREFGRRGESKGVMNEEILAEGEKWK